jgi:hypothetical protein
MAMKKTGSARKPTMRLPTDFYHSDSFPGPRRTKTTHHLVLSRETGSTAVVITRQRLRAGASPAEQLVGIKMRLQRPLAHLDSYDVEIWLAARERNAARARARRNPAARKKFLLNAARTAIESLYLPKGHQIDLQAAAMENEGLKKAVESLAAKRTRLLKQFLAKQGKAVMVMRAENTSGARQTLLRQLERRQKACEALLGLNA